MAVGKGGGRLKLAIVCKIEGPAACCPGDFFLKMHFLQPGGFTTLIYALLVHSFSFFFGQRFRKENLSG